MDGVTPRPNGVLLTALRGTRYASWRGHAALLGLIGGYIGLSAIRHTPDANIGLGLGLLALGVMGAPWSVTLFMYERMTLDSGLFGAVATGGGDLQPRGSCNGPGMEECSHNASAVAASPNPTLCHSGTSVPARWMRAFTRPAFRTSERALEVLQHGRCRARRTPAA